MRAYRIAGAHLDRVDRRPRAAVDLLLLLVLVLVLEGIRLVTRFYARLNLA